LDFFRSWHTSKIIDFEPYAMAENKLKEAVYLTLSTPGKAGTE